MANALKSQETRGDYPALVLLDENLADSAEDMDLGEVVVLARMGRKVSNRPTLALPVRLQALCEQLLRTGRSPNGAP